VNKQTHIKYVEVGVKWFSKEMRQVLEKPKNLKKEYWGNDSFHSLVSRLCDRLDELESSSTKRDVIKKCVDVANYAMMIADNTKRLGKPFIIGDDEEGEV